MEMHEWTKAVEDWAKSGLSKAEYCRRHELIYSTFVSHTNDHRWLGLLQRDAASFVRVEAKTVVEALSQTISSGVHVIVDDVRIDVDTRFDADALRSVMEVLRAGA